MSEELDGIHRDAISEVRDESAAERLEDAQERDREATIRDHGASDRDREARDRESQPAGGPLLDESVANAQTDRAHAAEDRRDSADDRAEAGADRSEAAADRDHAASDRLAASGDRAVGAFGDLAETQQLAAVLVSVDDAILTKDTTGKILTWNRAAEGLYGYAAAEAIGRPVSMLLPSDRPEELADLFQRFEHGEVALQLETARVRKDGSVVDVALSIYPVRGIDGDVVGATTIAHDISTRKNEAAAHMRLLAEIVQASQDGMLSRDLDGTTLTWNDAAARMFGYSAEEMIGTPLRNLLGAAVVPAGLEDLSAGANHGAKLPAIELELSRKDGSVVPVSIGTSPIADASGELIAVAVVIRDLTEQRRLEDELRQSQKLEAIGSLTAGLAHDFNNILTVIMGASERILSGLEDGPIRESASQIDQAAAHAAALTRQLLAFGRRQILVARPTDLNALVDETLTLVRRLITATILIEQDLDAELPAILVDRAQLQQIILNLSINSGEAMPEGGTLTFATSLVALDASDAHDDLKHPAGSSVLLEIRDTGVGMSNETRLQAFDPFFTTKTTGTGLGLATVYGIVKQSGGHITVESEVGVGTTFKIYLPPTDVAADDAPALTVPAEPLQSSGTILIVEDFPILRELTAQLLTEAGYTVLTAADGLEALETYANHPGVIDLLLTDVVMPRMSGRELSDKLTAKNVDLKVLFTSGYPRDTIVHDKVGERTVAFMQKPYGNTEFLDNVRALLAST